MKYILVLSLSAVLFLVFSSALNSKKCDCEELKACEQKYNNAVAEFEKKIFLNEQQNAALVAAHLARVEANNKMYQKQIDSLKLLIK